MSLKDCSEASCFARSGRLDHLPATDIYVFDEAPVLERKRIEVAEIISAGIVSADTLLGYAAAAFPPAQNARAVALQAEASKSTRRSRRSSSASATLAPSAIVTRMRICWRSPRPLTLKHRDRSPKRGHEKNVQPSATLTRKSAASSIIRSRIIRIRSCVPSGSFAIKEFGRYPFPTRRSGSDRSHQNAEDAQQKSAFRLFFQSAASRRGSHRPPCWNSNCFQRP